MESQRKLFYDKNPLPAKLNAISHRAGAARKSRDKTALDPSKAQEVLKEATEAVRLAEHPLETKKADYANLEAKPHRLAASTPEVPAARQQPETNLDASALVELLGTIKGARDPEAVAPRLLNALAVAAAPGGPPAPSTPAGGPPNEGAPAGSQEDACEGPPAKTAKLQHWGPEKNGIEKVRESVSESVSDDTGDEVVVAKAKPLAKHGQLGLAAGDRFHNESLRAFSLGTQRLVSFNGQITDADWGVSFQ
ncbi:unnamed protein product, partial [Prorocentrum cordatum]